METSIVSNYVIKVVDNITEYKIEIEFKNVQTGEVVHGVYQISDEGLCCEQFGLEDLGDPESNHEDRDGFVLSDLVGGRLVSIQSSSSTQGEEMSEEVVAFVVAKNGEHMTRYLRIYNEHNGYYPPECICSYYHPDYGFSLSEFEL